MTKDLPPPELLRKLLRYEPNTGKLFWLPRSVDLFKSGKYSADRAQKRWNTTFSGVEAFTANDNRGYKVGSIFNKLYRAHRVIWAIETGFWPDDEIDHIDGNTQNNRFKNLRLATHLQNMRNKRSNNGSSSKYLGVSFQKDIGKWSARIRANGKSIFLGVFSLESDAAKSYDKAAKMSHGEFANLNFKESNEDD